jgi:hypothetical protein
MGESEVRRIYAEQVDPEELLYLLSSRFGGAELDPAAGVFFPRREPFDVRLRISDDHVSDIEFGRSASSPEVDELANEVREKLLENQNREIVRRLIFCSVPFAGQYSAPDDVFHLVEAPPQAPRPPAFMGDHPLLIEFPIVASPDEMITMRRSHRALLHWIWFLNAVLLDHFKTQQSRQAWVLRILPEGSGPRFETLWANEGYQIPDWDPPEHVFTPLLGPKMSVQAEADYYSRRGVTVSDTLTLPDSFSEDVRRFSALEPFLRERFLQSGQWIAASRDLWGSHMSSWYIAQVAAIETLVHTDDPPDICSECGRDKNQRPTRRFKDFIDAYAPGAGSRSEIDRLYAVRSGLVHGGALLHHDSPFGGGLLAFAMDERGTMDRLGRAVTVAVVNWLRSPGRAD